MALLARLFHLLPQRVHQFRNGLCIADPNETTCIKTFHGEPEGSALTALPSRIPPLLICNEMQSSFEALGVDACGERGEYHTLVVGSPRMNSPLALREIGRLMHDGYWMLDLELA